MLKSVATLLRGGAFYLKMENRGQTTVFHRGGMGIDWKTVVCPRLNYPPMVFGSHSDSAGKAHSRKRRTRSTAMNGKVPR